jgi:hypothetical protein
MKTSIDIPDPLFKRIKIAAVEQGVTFREVMLSAVEAHLQQVADEAGDTPYFAQRKLTADFARLERAGGLKVDIDAALAEDRDGR